MNKHLLDKINESLQSLLENYQFSNGKSVVEMLSDIEIEDEIDDLITSIKNSIVKDIIESSFEFRSLNHVCSNCAIEFGEFHCQGSILDMLEILKNGRKILPL